MVWPAGRAGAVPAAAWAGRLRRRALAVTATLLALNALYIWVDRPLSVWLRDAPVWLIDLFQAITVAGNSKYTLVPLAMVLPILLAARHGLRDGPEAARFGWMAAATAFLFAAVALSGILVNVIKVLVGRSRPKLLMEEGIYGFDPFSIGYDWASFPSGHANTVVALALAVGLLMPRLRWVLLAPAAAVALSRVVINSHFLGDVAGGAALAVVTTVLLRDWFGDHGLVFVRRNDGHVVLAPSGRRLVAPLAGRRQEEEAGDA